MNVYKSPKWQQAIQSTYDTLLRQWGVPVEEMDVLTRYGTTHVIACGDKTLPPLILFHGVGDDSALMWIYNAHALSRHFRVYAVDTIGGPGKSVPGDMYNKDFCDVLWIDDVLGALSVDKAHFAGVSNGGYLVKLYTVSRPERVDKAISISSALSTGKAAKGKALLGMMKIFLPEALFPTEKNVGKLIRKLCGDNYAVFTDHADIMAHYTSLLRGFNNMAMGYHKVRGFTEEEISLIRDKVVFLVGREDPFEKLGGEASLREHRMNAIFYERAGHGLNHELAEEINAKMVEILKG